MEKDDEKDSDVDSLDSDGYDKLDPFAAQAKEIDRRNKLKEAKQQQIEIIADKIIAHKATLQKCEYIMKRLIIIALILSVLYINRDELYLKNFVPVFLTQKFDLFGFIYRLEREVYMVCVPLTLYVCALKIN